MGLPKNRPLFDDRGILMDFIAGTFFICGAPLDNGGFTDLPEALIEHYTKIFQLWWIGCNDHKILNDNIRTLEKLKKAYHRLCLKLHPDVGGSAEEVKILKAEYETLFARMKNIHVNKDGETYEKETQETSQEI